MSADGSTTLKGTPNPEAPNPQLPIVQKLRIRYAKRGRLRFTSHRDFGRAFERAVRRSGLPIAFSSGFNPHPKISYAGASPTGAASEAEYLEIGLTQVLDPAEVHRKLDDSLPPGLDVLRVVEAPSGALADLLTASLWRISLPGVDAANVETAVAGFLGQEEVLVERMMKKGLRTLNARAAVISASVSANSEGANLDVVLRHETPSIRPDDVLTGLRETCGLILGDTPVSTRIEQGVLNEASGTIADPLA